MGPAAMEALLRFQALSHPLKNLAKQGGAKGIDQALGDALPASSTRYQRGSQRDWDGQIHIETFSLGDLRCISAKTTPMVAQKDESERLSVVLQYQGKTDYRDGRDRVVAPQRHVLVHPNGSGTIHVKGGGAAITFELDPLRLRRTRRVMGGRYARPVGSAPMQAMDGAKGRRGALWFDLFAYVDDLLAEDQAFPAAMGLDEQIYRLMAFCDLRQSGAWRDSRWCDRHVTPSTKVAIGLEEYIREHCCQGLTLTDLEEWSHYSGRQLQNIFMERHGCTPMQFVRRQRLEAAMQKLQSAQPGDTVTSIARACGYRYLSGFSTDFQRRFGVAPSTLLRASRGRLSSD